MTGVIKQHINNSPMKDKIPEYQAVPYADIRDFFRQVCGSSANVNRDAFCIKAYERRTPAKMLDTFNNYVVQHGEVNPLAFHCERIDDWQQRNRRATLSRMLDLHAEHARFKLFPHKDGFTGSYVSDDNHHAAVTFVRSERGLVGCGWDCVTAKQYKTARRMAVGLMLMFGIYNPHDAELYEGAIGYLPLERIFDEDDASDFEYFYRRYLPEP